LGLQFCPDEDTLDLESKGVVTLLDNTSLLNRIRIPENTTNKLTGY